MNSAASTARQGASKPDEALKQKGLPVIVIRSATARTPGALAQPEDLHGLANVLGDGYSYCRTYRNMRYLEDLPTSEAEWRQRLTPEQYAVLRKAGTERSFTSQYVDTEDDGIYRCGACQNPLFDSQMKFHSGTGWPSFSEAVSPQAVELLEDASHGMVRVEARCARCHSHLGHVFDDGPKEAGGQRWCINGVALELDPR